MGGLCLRKEYVWELWVSVCVGKCEIVWIVKCFDLHINQLLEKLLWGQNTVRKQVQVISLQTYEIM